MKYKLVPSYFSPIERIEYGVLYGITIDSSIGKSFTTMRQDNEEIEKISFYRDISSNEKIAEIDEKLLEYWK